MTELDYNQLDQLHTTRCLLRPIYYTDAISLYHLYSNPLVIRYTEHHIPMQNLDEAQYSIQFYQRGYVEGWMIRWGVELINERRLIGTAGLHNLNADNHLCNIGYELNSPYWNRGLATEVVQALTTYAFQQLELNRIEAELIPQNVGSARVAQKNGYRYEATRRQRLRKRNSYHDIDIYGILRRDWETMT